MCIKLVIETSLYYDAQSEKHWIQKIVSGINSAKCFSILADETTDISTTDIFSLCVRHVDETEVEVREQFYSPCHKSNTSRQEQLANTFIESLKTFGIGPAYRRVQGYIGAASVSGKFKGVQIIVFISAGSVYSLRFSCFNLGHWKQDMYSKCKKLHPSNGKLYSSFKYT